jgi:hypothetical protein
VIRHFDILLYISHQFYLAELQIPISKILISWYFDILIFRYQWFADIFIFDFRFSWTFLNFPRSTNKFSAEIVFEKIWMIWNKSQQSSIIYFFHIQKLISIDIWKSKSVDILIFRNQFIRYWSEIKKSPTHIQSFAWVAHGWPIQKSETHGIPWVPIG